MTKLSPLTSVKEGNVGDAPSTEILPIKLPDQKSTLVTVIDWIWARSMTAPAPIFRSIFRKVVRLGQSTVPLSRASSLVSRAPIDAFVLIRLVNPVRSSTLPAPVLR